ncbi:Oidioi.mRNA.OKI2018_I69.PAR.g12758.t1.cds [Oikopleura dioica]|uniref:Oidioi.mRNA.OKI2018_I69.PAR.g12758.t1.cds n=1 Tax=Oikopleura dioica TaxID=34765 RepID=A0ABN7S7T8_OIKDI|nr:Oidioi.mRNA.OKI2018_I69.PAR.g12758.t1.cds [Oikopleura dioica]
MRLFAPVFYGTTVRAQFFDNDQGIQQNRDWLLQLRESRLAGTTCSNSVGSDFDKLCSDNNSKNSCNMAKLCCWNGVKCIGKSQNAGNVAQMIVDSPDFQAVAGDAKKPKSFEEQSFVRNTLSDALPNFEKQDNDAVSLEARSAFLTGFNGGMDMFDSRMSLLSGSGPLNDYLSCPVNIPFCNRKKCTNMYGQDPLTAGECFSIPGCCFDHNLQLYRMSFGQTFMRGTPVCYQAISTPMYKVFSGAMTFQHPWFMQPIVNKINDFADTDQGYRLMMEMHQCPMKGQLTSATLRFEQQLSQIWPMYTTLRFKGSQIMDDLLYSLAPFCGWTGVTKGQCMLVGCCWSETTNSCLRPVDLSSGFHNRETVSQAAMAVLLKFGKESEQPGGSRYGQIVNGGRSSATGMEVQALFKKPKNEFERLGMGEYRDKNGNLLMPDWSMPPSGGNNNFLNLSGRRRRRSAAKSRNRRSTSSKLSTLCANPMIQMIPSMSTMCTKIDMLNVFKTGLSGKSSDKKSGSKDGSRQGLMDMMIGPSFGGLNQMMANSAGTSGLDYASLLDSSQDQSLVNRLSLMQMMMPNMRPQTNAYNTWKNQQQTQYGPFNQINGQYSPQAIQSTPNSLTETGSGSQFTGSSYRAPSISSMYSQFGSIQSQQCPAHDETDHSDMQSCLAPYSADTTPTFEELGQDKMACAAKGCCWDNDINRGVLLSKDVLERLCMWKVPIAGERWGLPTLDTSMEGCCRQHPCRTIPPKPVDPQMNVRQAAYSSQTAPKFENAPFQNAQPQTNQFQPIQPQTSQFQTNQFQSNQFQNSNNFARTPPPSTRPTTTTRTTTTTTTRTTVRTYPTYQNPQQFQPANQYLSQSGMRPVPPQQPQGYPVQNVQIPDQSAYQPLQPAYDNNSYSNVRPAQVYTTQKPTYVELKPAYDQQTYNNFGQGSGRIVATVVDSTNGARSGPSTSDSEHKGSSLEWSDCIPNESKAGCGPGLRTKGEDAISCKIPCEWSDKWVPLTKCSKSCGRGVVTLTKRCPVKGYCKLENGKPPRRKSSCKVRNC